MPRRRGQVWCGTLPFPTVGAAALHVSFEFLKRHARQWWQLQARFGVLLVTGLLLWKTAGVGQDYREFARKENLGLPGAALFRLPPVEAGTWRWLADDLRRFDTFVTMPGLNSLYFWTGKEPPATCNATAWVSLFDDTTQSRIVANLGKYGRVGGVRSRERTAAWVGTLDVSAKPLGRFMEHQMKPIGERNGYEVMEAIPANPP